MDYKVSNQKGKECYNKPCACLNCEFETICAVGAKGNKNDRPCDYCDGAEGDRLSTFHCPMLKPKENFRK